VKEYTDVYMFNGQHPRWQQKDGLLLLHPAETQEALFLRRIEKEVFKGAVLSNKPGEIIGWVKEALSYREQRLSMINSAFRQYEKEFQFHLSFNPDPSLINLLNGSGIYTGLKKQNFFIVILDKQNYNAY